MHLLTKPNFEVFLGRGVEHLLLCWAVLLHFLQKKTLLLVWNEKEIYYSCSPIVRIKDALMQRLLRLQASKQIIIQPPQSVDAKQTFNQNFDIVRMRQVIGLDLRIILRIRGPQADFSTGLWPQQYGVERVSFAKCISHKVFIKDLQQGLFFMHIVMMKASFSDSNSNIIISQRIQTLVLIRRKFL